MWNVKYPDPTTTWIWPVSHLRVPRSGTRQNSLPIPPPYYTKNKNLMWQKFRCSCSLDDEYSNNASVEISIHADYDNGWYALYEMRLSQMSFYKIVWCLTKKPDVFSAVDCRYTLFYNSEQTGMPVMKPLWVDFPADKLTFKLEDEHLVGLLPSVVNYAVSCVTVSQNHLPTINVFQRVTVNSKQ